MLARLALETDRPTLHALARMHTAEKAPHLVYSPERAEATFQRYLTTGNPVFWVVEAQRQVVGYATGVLADNAFTDGFSASLDVIFVRPDMRGTRASAELISAFTTWAARLCPNDTFLTMANGDSGRNNSPAMARFLKRFGFRPAGSVFRI